MYKQQNSTKQIQKICAHKTLPFNNIRDFKRKFGQSK